MGQGPYRRAIRLIGIARHRWSWIDGEAAFHGADLSALPVDRFLNAVFVWCATRVEDVAMFEYELDKPIPGQDPDKVTEFTVEEEMAGFAALMSATSGRSGPTG